MDHRRIQPLQRVAVLAGVFALSLSTASQSADAAVFPQVDRQAMKAFQAAEKAVKEKRYSDAFTVLDKFLKSSQDHFFQKSGTQVYQSLRTAAETLVGELPEDGRRQYESQFGVEARQLLDKALAAGDERGLADVSRRYFYTDAGFQATHRLGRRHLDRGRHFSAALWLSRLRQSPEKSEKIEPLLSIQIAACWLRAGVPDKAAEVLLELKTRKPHASVRIAGRGYELFEDDEQAVAWLGRIVRFNPAFAPAGDDWRLAGGDVRRNATTKAGVPYLDVLWSAVDDEAEDLSAEIAKIESRYRELQLPAIPSVQPIVVGDVAVWRNAGVLTGTDLATGRMRWKVYEQGASIQQVMQWTQNAPLLAQQLLTDGLTGRVTSDGENVYSVQSIEVPVAGQHNNAPIHVFNRLAAHDVRTGKFKWEVGGNEGDDLPLAGAFFLGPPLPLAGKLYAIAEGKNDVRLYVIDPATGRSEWSQLLALLDSNRVSQRVYRTFGVSPSYADGVLVCPTGVGAVTAVDPASRSLLWGYEYSRSTPSQVAGMVQTNVWSLAQAVIGDGRVLLTSPDSQTLTCLNLKDGTPAWDEQRRDGLYVGRVGDDRVLVVNRTGVRALNLKDGKEAWNVETGGVPSGTGYDDGKRYYLPLASGEVAVVDHTAGRVVLRSKSPEGRVPGNLAAVDGAVVSVGLFGLDKYDQLDARKSRIDARLAKNPDDAAALAERGETAIVDGELDRAIADLKRSLELESRPRTRERLAHAMLERRRLKPADSNTDAIEDVVTGDAERTALARIKAEQLQNSGRLLEAYEAYLGIAGDARAPRMIAQDGSLTTRSDRWFQGKLSELYSIADDAQKQRLDVLVRRKFDEADASGDIDDWRAFLAFYGGRPLARDAHLRLAAVWSKTDSVVNAEKHLLDAAAGDRSFEVASTAKLAGLMRDFARTRDAAYFYDRLADKLADVAAPEGVTGRQLLERLDPRGPVRSQLSRRSEWPTGAVDDQLIHQTGGAVVRRHVPIHGDPGPVFVDQTVVFEQGAGLVGLDSLGRALWRLPTSDLFSYGVSPRNQELLDARAYGHVLVVRMGRFLVGVNTVDVLVDDSASVLWSHNTLERDGVTPVNLSVSRTSTSTPWGAARFDARDNYARPVGLPGPLTSTGICVQNGHDLVCLDPLTGDAVWTRRGTPLGCVLFGDDEYLFCTPRDDGETIVLRTVDGVRVGTRKLIQDESFITTLGRRVLLWDNQSEDVKLRLHDAWEQKDVWTHTLKTGSKAWLVDSQEIAVFEPTGKFDLLRIDDGKKVIDASLPPDAKSTGVFAVRWRDMRILIVNHSWQSKEKNVQRQAPQIFGTGVMINGPVYGFRPGRNEPVWKTRVKGQALELPQPFDLPILNFTSSITVQTQGRGGWGGGWRWGWRGGWGNQQQQFGDLIVIDKRTGRKLLEASLPDAATPCTIEVRPETSSIRMNLQRSTLRLRLTSKPLPPPEPEPEESEEEKANEDAVQPAQIEANPFGQGAGFF